MSLRHKIDRVKQFAINALANCQEAPIIILLYHRVCEIKNDCQGLAVSPKNFDQQIKFLSQNYPILCFDADWSQVKQTSFVITFDDGYSDNETQALPILAKYSSPATFFVAAENIQTGNEFWWDQLEQIITNTQANLDKLQLPIALPTSKEQLIIQLQLALKSFSVPKRKNFINQLAQQAKVKLVTRTTHRPLTEKELIALDSEKLVTIGSHTINHPQLSALSYAEQKDEINNGKIQLEAILKHSIETFSYPFGNKNDFSAITIDICKKSSICKVAANFPGQVHSWTNPYQLPRHLVRNWDINEFKNQFFRFKYL
jgi:peptidoglycan/xylan/chitin deacetylase (PgdA/CDA1 family)